MSATFRLILLCVTLSLACQAYAADPGEGRKITGDNESAFIGGIGTGTIQEGRYQPALLIWHVGFDLKKDFPGLTTHRGSLSAFFEPQFNPSHNPDNNFEFGIGVGIQYRYPLTEKIWGYLLGSIGPHYISLVTESQANGFIFSDTLGGGLYYFLSEGSAINIGYRFRHMSNAGLRYPNGGINTDILTVGYAIFF
ncbi:MAG: acyloxyacyl hydrolase [Syntrophales bacterium LBB04]|nr:acyloxyacyl hydrolase [Syntrophales bacterium LBB04]